MNFILIIEQILSLKKLKKLDQKNQFKLQILENSHHFQF